MKKVVIILSWILVLVWMGFIYYLSDMNGVESTSKSEKTINVTIQKVVEASNEIGLIKKNPNSKKISKVSELLDYPLRKCMHASVYFILTLLLINALNKSQVKGKKIFLLALLISFLYACTDEFHQYFRARTASLIDVYIDFVGSYIAIYLVIVSLKIKNKKRKI